VAGALSLGWTINNLVFADPDGYFKLKPKETPQKLAE
jgi:hypothetical protein